MSKVTPAKSRPTYTSLRSKSSVVIVVSCAQLIFLLGFDSVVELGGVDYGAPMRPRADLFDFVEGAHGKLETAAFDFGDFSFGVSEMPRRSRGAVIDFDRHADRTFARVEKRPDGIHRGKLHHPDHRRRGHDGGERRVETNSEVGGRNGFGVSSPGPDWNWFHRLAHLAGSDLASQTHRVEFLDDPFDAVVAPKWFAIDDENRHAEDTVAIAGGERIGEFAWAVVKRVAVESVGVETRFLHHGGERGGVFNVEFAFEEALEDTAGVRAKQPVLVGPQPGHESQFRVEDFLRSADDHAARVRVTARVEVEVADFAPLRLGPRVEIAAESAADVEFVRYVMQADAMRFHQRVRGRHREVRERTLVVVIELDGQEFVGHAITVDEDLAPRGEGEQSRGVIIRCRRSVRGRRGSTRARRKSAAASRRFASSV